MSQPDFDAIGARLLESGQSAEVIELDAPAPRRLICFGSHRACLEVLQDDAAFSLRPYDAAFAELLPDEDLKAILGENSTARTFRVEMLRAASAGLAAKLAPKTTPSATRPQDALVDWVADLTRQNCETLIEILRHRHRRRKGFNLVREYIWPLAYMSVRDIIGFRMPDRLSPGAAVLLLARNLDSLRAPQRAWICPKGDLAAATNMHFSMLTLGGHIVAAGSGGDRLTRLLARHSLKHFLASYGTPESYRTLSQPLSLAQMLHDPAMKKALLAADTTGVTSADYDIFARNTVMETVIAMGGLMPLAFTKAFQFATGPMLETAGIDRATLAKELADPATRKAAFSECLRLNPPVPVVFRTATRDARVGDIDIAEGDQLALLFGSAARDPDAFPDPARFELGRNGGYLEFGHALSPHNCFGEHLAKTIFGVMFDALHKVARPDFGPKTDGLYMFARKLPDDMPWTFNPP